MCACAGALIAANANDNFLTRMQGWDYRLGINGVKRTQAAYNSALVAQGAFSAYWTDDIRAVGGWPDAIGEDIVLTWSLMDSRGLVQYEPCALAATLVPREAQALHAPRSRWARGMIEGIGINPPHRQPRVLAKFVAGIDYLVPLLDIGYVFFWIPGVICSSSATAALLVVVDAHDPDHAGRLRAAASLAGPHVFRPLRVHPEPDRRGFFGYLFIFQALTSVASLRGYGQQLPGARGAGSRLDRRRSHGAIGIGSGRPAADGFRGGVAFVVLTLLLPKGPARSPPRRVRRHPPGLTLFGINAPSLGRAGCERVRDRRPGRDRGVVRRLGAHAGLPARVRGARSGARVAPSRWISWEPWDSWTGGADQPAYALDRAWRRATTMR